MVDVNLKFNKPEINITIDREKAQSLGVSVIDVAQTLQLSLSGQRFGYFMMNGRQYQVIGQFRRKRPRCPDGPYFMFVRSNTGQLIQLDNLVKVEERSAPPPAPGTFPCRRAGLSGPFPTRAGMERGEDW